MAKQINIRGVIVRDDDKWIYDWLEIAATSPNDVRNVLAEACGEDVEVTINSGGGDVQAGQEMYTLLRGYAGKILIRIQSMAASAASIIAMAGESEISPVAQMMIHNVSTRAQGDHRAMEHAAEVLRSSDRALVSAYVAKTGRPEDEILDMMARETWMTAQEAVENGFVDRIMFEQPKASAAPLQLAASYNAGLLPQETIEKLRANFNRETAKAKAEAQYHYMILEGKIK